MNLSNLLLKLPIVSALTMITESVPPINYHIIEPVPAYFSSKPKFLWHEPIISVSILVIDPKNLANVPFFIITTALK